MFSVICITTLKLLIIAPQAPFCDAERSINCRAVKVIVQTDYMFLWHKKSASFLFHLSSRKKTMSIHD